MSLLTGVPVCNSLVRGESLNELRNLALKLKRHRFIVRCTKYFDTLYRLCKDHQGACRQTDAAEFTKQLARIKTSVLYSNSKKTLRPSAVCMTHSCMMPRRLN